MDKNNKYYAIIEQMIKSHKKFSGYESILEDIIDDVIAHSEVIISSVANENVINAYLEKVVSTSIITVPKKLGFNKFARHTTITTKKENIEPKIEVNNKSQEITPEPIEEFVPEPIEEIAPEPIKEIRPSQELVDKMINSAEKPMQDSFDKQEASEDKLIVSDDIFDEENNESIAPNEEIHSIEELFQTEEPESFTNSEPEISEINTIEPSTEEPFQIEETDSSFIQEELIPEEGETLTIDENISEDNSIYEEIPEFDNLQIVEYTEESPAVNVDIVEKPQDLLEETEIEEDKFEEIEIEEAPEEEINTFDTSLEESNEFNIPIEENITLEEEEEEEEENILKNETPIQSENTILQEEIVPLEETDSLIDAENDLHEESLFETDLDHSFDDSLDSSLDLSDNSAEILPELNSDGNLLEETEIGADLEQFGDDTLIQNVENKKSDLDNKTIKTDYSVFDYTPSQDSDEDFAEIASDINKLNGKFPSLKIIEIYNLKYKDNLSVDDIAKKLELEKNQVISALTKIIDVI